MSGRSRERLRPWLEACLDDGRVPGLMWLNREERIFRIPWKHAGKQDWKADDAAVFVEWAKHTGKYREGIDDPEYAKFKTRLRCAFNKSPGIKEIKEQSNEEDPDAPYKVYRLLSTRETGKNNASPDTASSVSNESSNMGLTDFSNEQMISQGFSSTSKGEHSVALPSNSLPSLVQALADNVKTMSISGGSLPSELKNLPSYDLLECDPAQMMSFSDYMKSHPEDSQMDTESDHRDAATGFVEGQQPGTPAEPDAAIGVLCQQSPSYFKQEASSQASPGFQAQTYSPAPSPTHNADPSIAHYQAASPADSTSSHAYTLMPAVSPLPVQSFSNQPVFGQDAVTASSAAGTTVDHDYSQAMHSQGRDMVIRIYYSSHCVAEEIVTGYPDGCRLYFTGSKIDVARVSSIPMEYRTPLFGTTEKVRHIHFPPASALDAVPSLANSVMIKKHTQGLLDSTSRGLIIQRENGNIFATRFCKCVTYHNSVETNGFCIKMQRPDKDINHLRKHVYSSFSAGEDSATSGVYFMFGQEGNIAQLNSVLIAVHVLGPIIPCNGDNLPLVSDSNSFDEIAKQLQETVHNGMLT